MRDRRPSEPATRPVTVAEVHTGFARLLRNRRHMGLRNLLGDTFLEPRNPFQPTRREPKKWPVAIGGIALLALLAAYFFHIR